MNRRAFLRTASLVAAGTVTGYAVREAAALNQAMEPFALGDGLLWTIRGQLQALRAPAVVARDYCPTYDEDLRGRLHALWTLADMPSVAGSRVLVKPNLIDAISGRPVTTAPEVVGAVVDLLTDLGAAEVVVGEGSGFRRDPAPLLEATGLDKVLSDRGMTFIDLNYDDPRPVPTVDGWFPSYSSLWLPRHVREADWIISIPKMKTHHWTRVSLSMKNLFGVVPGCRYGWPKNILHVNGVEPSILGLARLLPNALAVVDGIAGMEGDGPLLGQPVQHGLLALGRDTAAVDASCVALMGLAAADVPYLARALAAGVGRAARIEQRGELPSIARRMYQLPPTGTPAGG